MYVQMYVFMYLSMYACDIMHMPKAHSEQYFWKFVLYIIFMCAYTCILQRTKNPENILEIYHWDIK